MGRIREAANRTLATCMLLLTYGYEDIGYEDIRLATSQRRARRGGGRTGCSTAPARRYHSGERVSLNRQPSAACSRPSIGQSSGFSR